MVSMRFLTTRWSLVLAAGQAESPDSREALATLCQAYWYPLYTYARRQVPSRDDAQDLTQEFFARVLEKDYLRAADRQRGKFRAFLLTAFKHFLANEHERAAAQKRGGGRKPLPLDFDSGELRYSREPSHDWTAERIYERRWALTLLDQVLGRLRQEFDKADKQPVFEALKGFLAGDSAAKTYQQIGEALDLSEAAVKTAVYRLRKRYHELLRDEIAQTVDTPEEIDDELRHLLAAVGT